MKNLFRIFTIFWALQAIAVQADGLSCLPFEAETDAAITPDASGTCAIRAIVNESRGKYFQDLKFLGEFPGLGTVCYSGSITDGHIGGVPGDYDTGIKIKASFVNGITSVDLNPQNFFPTSLSAAGIYTIVTFDGKKQLGKLYTQEVVLADQSPTTEYAIVVDGTKLFNKGMGNWRITGDALSGPVTLNGTVCMETERGHFVTPK